MLNESLRSSTARAREHHLHGLVRLFFPRIVGLGPSLRQTTCVVGCVPFFRCKLWGTTGLNHQPVLVVVDRDKLLFTHIVAERLEALLVVFLLRLTGRTQYLSGVETFLFLGVAHGIQGDALGAEHCHLVVGTVRPVIEREDRLAKLVLFSLQSRLLCHQLG